MSRNVLDLRALETVRPFLLYELWDTIELPPCFVLRRLIRRWLILYRGPHGYVGLRRVIYVKERGR